VTRDQIAPPETAPKLETFIHRAAEALGAGAVGIARITEAQVRQDAAHLARWLEAGHAGAMRYMGRDPERRADPRRSLERALSVVVAAFDYSRPADDEAWERRAEAAGAGRVARYARGRDYHGFLRKRMRRLLAAIQEREPALRGRVFVDSGPLLERAWAARAGVGWVGKHSLVLRQKGGSWSCLGALLLDAPLAPDAPAVERCGACRRCLDICPTGAIVAPYVVDARRCISYLTIELRGPIPIELRPAVGDHLFGCDLCQAACPWNRFAQAARLTEFEPRDALRDTPVEAWLVLDTEAFRRRFQGTPLARPGRDGFLRNACVVLGNRRDPASLPALRRALLEDASPLVRGHAAWALGRFAHGAARAALEEAWRRERDTAVRHEIEAALGRRAARGLPESRA
jgi:epoxyqueuosine reductase